MNANLMALTALSLMATRVSTPACPTDESPAATHPCTTTTVATRRAATSAATVAVVTSFQATIIVVTVSLVVLAAVRAIFSAPGLGFSAAVATAVVAAAVATAAAVAIAVGMATNVLAELMFSLHRWHRWHALPRPHGSPNVSLTSRRRATTSQSMCLQCPATSPSIRSVITVPMITATHATRVPVAAVALAPNA